MMKSIRILLLAVIGASFNGVWAAGATGADEKLAAAAAALSLQKDNLPGYARTMRDSLERLKINPELTGLDLERAGQAKQELVAGFDQTFTTAWADASAIDDKRKKEKFIKKQLDNYMHPHELSLGGIVSDFAKQYGPEDSFDKKMRQDREAEEARIRAAQQGMPAPVMLENHAGLQNVKQAYETAQAPEAMPYLRNKMQELSSLKKFGALTEKDIERVIAELKLYLSTEGWKNRDW